MEKETAWLVFIVDRSGSMLTINKEMEQGILSILSEQKNIDNNILVTAALFDDKYEIIYNNTPIEEINSISIEPRGSTAMLEAIHKTIELTEENYLKEDEEKKPKKVLFIIVTDGEENCSSEEYTYNSVSEIKANVEKVYGWNFTFVGTNNAMKEGERIGIDSSLSLSYEASSKGVKKMSESVSNYVCSYLSDEDASF